MSESSLVRARNRGNGADRSVCAPWYGDGAKRWGRYEPKTRTVVLNWMLFQAPAGRIRYVLAHELAHAIPHPGRRRGPEFWRLVTRALPEWQQERAELDFFGRQMWVGNVQPG